MLVSVDEYARSREGNPELPINVTSTVLDSEDAQHALRPENVRQLAGRLMTEYHRAQFRSRRAALTWHPRRRSVRSFRCRGAG